MRPQHPAPDDKVGNIIAEMTASEWTSAAAPPVPERSVDRRSLSWAGEAGLVGEVHLLERQWRSSPSQELRGDRSSPVAGHRASSTRLASRR